MRSVYTLRQQHHESLDVYYRRFKSVINTAEMLKAVVALHPGLVEIEPTNDNKGVIKTDAQIETTAINKYKAMILLLSADPKTYSSIWSDLELALTLGDNKYPVDITSAFEILAKCKDTSSLNQNTGTSFAQLGTDAGEDGITTAPTSGASSTAVTLAASTDTDMPVPGTNGVLLPHVTCWHCSKPGHVITFCPFRSQTFAQFGLTFSHSHVPDLVPKTWLLLDTGSTITSIMNANLVTDIVPTP